MRTWIGVDVSKRTLDIAVFGQVGIRRFEQPRQLEEVVTFIKASVDPQVVMESTGRYEQPLFEALNDAGVACTIINPARAHAFKKSLGSLAKTDAIDAAVLAHLGDALKPDPTPSKAPINRDLEALVRRRAQLVEQMVSEANHAEHGSCKIVERSIDRMRKIVRREIAALEKAIEKTVAKSAELSKRSHRLQTVPGVGPVVATVMLIELPELGTLSKSQVAALAGLAPYNHDSGLHKGKRTIRAGRGFARRVLYMGALVAKQHNPILKNVYERLIDKGKAKKVALIAVARKLVVILNALLKNNQDWDPRCVAP